MRPIHPAFFLSIALAGCDPAPPPTQLVVHVIDGSGGALRVPADLDAFEIRVATVTSVDAPPRVRFRRSWRLSPSDGLALSGSVALPQTLAIVPAAADGTGTVRVDVVGLRRGRALQRIHRTVAFGVGRIDLPPFALTPLCFGVECPPDQTCEADGTCRAATGPPDAGVTPTDGGPCGAGLVPCGDTCVPTDEANCGGCGIVCPAGERCITGRCACGVGLVRCGAACIDVGSDPSHCGACDAPCVLPNATSSCAGGSCRIASCSPGTGDCNGNAADGCEITFGSDAHCTACGDACALPRASSSCNGGVCVVSACDSGWDDCNRADGDGCETRLGTSGNCRSCGDGCPLFRASSACSSGSCVIASCDSGWGNCDGNQVNGCETDLGTRSDCGACGNACGAYERCAGGSCDCEPGFERGTSGNCITSCGHLANVRRITDDGMGCCPAGCNATVIGGPGETTDCTWCCENAGGASGCL